MERVWDNMLSAEEIEQSRKYNEDNSEVWESYKNGVLITEWPVHFETGDILTQKLVKS